MSFGSDVRKELGVGDLDSAEAAQEWNWKKWSWLSTFRQSSIQRYSQTTTTCLQRPAWAPIFQNWYQFYRNKLWITTIFALTFEQRPLFRVPRLATVHRFESIRINQRKFADFSLDFVIGHTANTLKFSTHQNWPNHQYQPKLPEIANIAKRHSPET
jgi:hypothetical protein